jgi:hypothetical protein
MPIVTACRKFFFLLISIFTLGAVLAIFVLALVMGEKLQFFKSDPQLRPFAIAGTAISFLIFLFSVIVSCTQKRGCRIALAGIFVIFALLLLVTATVALVREGDVVPGLAGLWTRDSKRDRDLVEALQDAFGCCGWNETKQDCARKGRPCVQVIKPDVEHYWKGAAAILLGFAGVLLILGGVAFKCACSEPKAEEHISLESLRYTGPIYPGIRPVDSRGHYKYTW